VTTGSAITTSSGPLATARPVNRAMVTLYRVLAVKHVTDARTFVAVTAA
jgi:hypothetical protein